MYVYSIYIYNFFPEIIKMSICEIHEVRGLGKVGQKLADHCTRA